MFSTTNLRGCWRVPATKDPTDHQQKNMPHIYEQGYRIGKKNARAGILCNLLLFIVKSCAGIFGRSQALLADAFHTAGDALTSVAVLIGFNIAIKPADEHHPFGHGKAEPVAAKIVSIILILTGISIVYSSAKILISEKINEPAVITLFAALLSIIVKQIMYKKVLRAAKKINSVSLAADAHHHRSDALSSIAAVIGIVGARLGYTFMDPAAGIIVAGFIIKIGVETFHAAYDELLDAAPPEEFYVKVKHITSLIDGVLEVKKIMIRKTGIELFVEIIVGIDGKKTVEEGHKITDIIRENIFNEMLNVKDVNVHVEPKID